MKRLSTESWRPFFPNPYPGNGGWRVPGDLCAFPPSTSAQDTAKLIEAVIICQPYSNSILFTFEAAALWSLSVYSECRGRGQMESSLSAQHGPAALVTQSDRNVSQEKRLISLGSCARAAELPRAVTPVPAGGPWVTGGDRDWCHRENNCSDSSFFFSPTDLAYKSFLSSKKEMAVLFLLNCSDI